MNCDIRLLVMAKLLRKSAIPSKSLRTAQKKISEYHIRNDECRMEEIPCSAQPLGNTSVAHQGVAMPKM